MKDPAFLFYPNDYLGGTLGMTFEEKGAYIELLMVQFNRGHMSTHMIGQVVGQLWESVKDKFILDENGLYYNARLEVEQNKRKAFSDSRRNNLKGENQYTKKKKETKKQSGHMTTHMENENENINILIEEIYSLYPSKCIVKNTSTGKSKHDKDKIRTLLKSNDKDVLISKIKRYISECKSGNIYMKNFSTFLNNLPDYSEQTDNEQVFSKVKYIIDGETVTHNKKAYLENLEQYGEQRVKFIKYVE